MIQSFLGIDTYVAFGLIGIVVVMFLLSKMNVLPKKSLLFVAAALAGVFGLSLLRERRTKHLRKDLEEREKKLKEQEQKLKDLHERYGLAEDKLSEAKAELERQRSAYEKAILHIREKNEEEKKRIDALSGEELHHEFRSAFGSSQ